MSGKSMEICRALNRVHSDRTVRTKSGSTDVHDVATLGHRSLDSKLWALFHTSPSLSQLQD